MKVPSLTWRLVRRAALALAAGAALLALAPAAHAQDLPLPGDGFAWERLGNATPDAHDLAFTDDGQTLWVVGNGGLYRLDFSDGEPGVWVLVNDRVANFDRLLPLGRGPTGDTLVATTGGSTRRSLDGGLSFTHVHYDGYKGLYELPPDHPNAGRILTGDGDGVAASDDIAYSDDRAATFTTAAVPAWGGARAFVAFPPGSAYAGRVLATGDWGAMFSDDGGETWSESNLWQVARYQGHGLCFVERPGSGSGSGSGSGEGLRALAFGFDATEPVLRAWASDDGGETWADVAGFPEGPPYGVGGAGAGLFSLGGASALAVGGRGTVYRTDDAGETWKAVGRAPEVSDVIYASTAEVGPDGRLYVGLVRIGPPDAPIYRTEPLVTPTAAEPDAPGEPEEPSLPSGEALGVSVRPNPASGTAEVVLRLREPSTVEAVLYDGLGRRVALLAQGRYGAGRHALTLDGVALPAGLYVVHVTARTAGGLATAVERLTLTR